MPIRTAAACLNADAEELGWLALPIPAAYQRGPLTMLLAFPKAAPLRFQVLAADPAARLLLLAHRHRTAFTQQEDAYYWVIVAKGVKAGEARILCKPAAAADAKPIELGAVDLPAVTDRDFDSRGFMLRIRDLPQDDYLLWIESASDRSPAVPLTVVPWLIQRSPFFAHTMSGCTGLWPTDESGLQLLFDSGIQMATGTGFSGLLSSQMPAIDPGRGCPRRGLRPSARGRPAARR